MDYAELLSRKEWQDKREEILKRDKYLCQNCHNTHHFERFQRGLYKKIPARNNVIAVRDFQNMHYNPLRAKPNLLNDMPDNGILYFEENKNRWINIVAYRGLINEEQIIYIDEPKKVKLYKYYLKELEKHQLIDLSAQKYIDEKSSQFGEIEIAPNDVIWEKVFGLHVHHTYYINGKLPWEYENEALITLCWKCHEEKHRNGKITVYDSLLNPLGEYHYCKRCSGAGRFPEFSHVQKGVCFRCHGARYEELIGK